EVAISWFIGDVGNTLLFAVFAFLALREVGFRLELLGGDEVQSADTAGVSMPASVQQAFDVLASIAEQQRTAFAEQRRIAEAVYEPNRYNLTNPQGLYSVFALQDELERQRQRQVQRQRERSQEWQRVPRRTSDDEEYRDADE